MEERERSLQSILQTLLHTHMDRWRNGSPLVGHNAAVSLLEGQLYGGVVVQVKEEESLATQCSAEEGVGSGSLPSKADRVWIVSQWNLVYGVALQVVDGQRPILGPQSQQILQSAPKGQQCISHTTTDRALIQK